MIVLLLVSFLAGRFALAAHAQGASIDIPPLAAEEEFIFTNESHHAGRYQFSGDEPTRRRILAALSQPNRDVVLETMLPVTWIAGEKWFNLSGITVRQRDIDGNATLSRINWDGSRFLGVDLTGADFSYTLLRGVSFEQCDLTGANFDQAALDCARFQRCKLERASFKLARFGHDRTQFQFCDLDHSNFDNSSGLRGIYDSSARGASFKSSALVGTHFTLVKMRRADFSDSDLSQSDFFGSDLGDVDFSRSVLTDAKLNFALAVPPPKFSNTRVLRTEFGSIDPKLISIGSLNWIDGDFRIGEEIRADEFARNATGAYSQSQAELYARSEVIYRTLADLYKRLGYSEEYLRLRFRSLEARRKLLDMRPFSNRPERVRLAAWRFWDRYGTSLDIVVRRYIAVVVFFALLHLFAWTLFNRDWAEWRSQSAGSTNGISSRLCPADEFQRTPRRRRLRKFLQLAPTALLFSTASTLLFAEKIFDARRILELLQTSEDRLVPVGIGRIWVFMEATLGVLFFYSIVTRIVLLLPN